MLPSAWGQSDPADFAYVYDLPADDLPFSFSGDTQVNVYEEGRVGGFFSLGGAVEWNLLGGAFIDHTQLTPIGQDPWSVNVLDGEIGDGFYFRSHNYSVLGVPSTLNVVDGAVGDNLFATGIGLTVSGGSIGNNARVEGAQAISITGGSIGEYAYLETSPYATGPLVMSGGVIGPFATIRAPLELIGGDFLLDGVAAPTGVGIDDFDVLTGVLEDGSVFIVRAMGLKPSPSGETFRFLHWRDGELPHGLAQPL